MPNRPVDLLAGSGPRPPRRGPPPPRDGIEQDFRRFHRDNPHVYHELVRLARGLLGRGRIHWGIAALFEVLRYNRAIQTDDTEFKLNNNYRALYARLIMDECPDLDGFFEIRERITTRPVEDW